MALETEVSAGVLILNKILVTGGSGFIGSNLLQYFLDRGDEVKNIDIQAPRNGEHNQYWLSVDLLNLDALSAIFSEFKPDYIVHLGARTDLNETEDIMGYDANMKGVNNLIEVVNNTPSVKRAVFASSMLVCKFGYIPQDSDDYCPDTLYGESKVKTEKIIKESSLNTEWLIVRPSSIWGPWFAEPYLNFFQMILSNRFVHPGHKSGTATFGYVGNAVFQIARFLEAPVEMVNHKVFYLGDYKPYNLSEWADEIAGLKGLKILRVPFWLLRSAASVGDIFQRLNIQFPLTSFRLSNMTKDNQLDLSETRKVAPQLPYTRKEGVEVSIKWGEEQGKF